MHFNNVDEIQELLDKTTSIEDRLQTSLLLLSCKFAELKDVIAPLQAIAEKLQQEVQRYKQAIASDGPS